VTRRRDLRRFGPGPYLVGLRRDETRWREGFPYDVPAVAAVEELRLDAPVTLLAGDNGTGKSTLVEAIAEAIGFAPEGGELTRLGELPAVPRPVLDGALDPVLTRTKPRNGYFLRAESFFNIASFVDEAGEFAPDLSIYELDDAGLRPCAYDDLDAVRLTRGFLEAPERYLRAALEPADGD
jgi:predicted ATPase